jgi:hypothetical protein
MSDRTAVAVLPTHSDEAVILEIGRVCIRVPRAVDRETLIAVIAALVQGRPVESPCSGALSLCPRRPCARFGGAAVATSRRSRSRAPSSQSTQLT